nr:hypothetical protein [Tanacetum cinerariifolium]
ADYPTDRRDNDNDESSNDDKDDDVEKDEEEKEEEEHLAPEIQTILSPQAENTEAFETDESASTPSTFLPPPLEKIKSLKDNIRV